MENSKGVLLWIFGIIIGFFWLIGYTNEKSLDYHYTAETPIGGHSKAPKWFKITLWVLLVLNFLAIIGLTQ